MITHLVFFKMLPEAGGQSAERNAHELIARLQALPGEIPEIVELEAGRDFSASPASYDVGLVTRFRDRKDLEAYRVHPQHQKVVAFVQATTAARAVVDYETA